MSKVGIHYQGPDVRSVELIGREGVELLQRISTADLSKINLGQSQLTCLLNEKGRLVDVAAVQRVDEERTKIHSMKGDQQGLMQWLEKFIIMENLEIVSDPEPSYRISAFFNEMDPTLSSSFTAGEMNGMKIAFDQVPPRMGSEVALLTEEEYCRLRVEHLIPEWGYELSVERNPLEVNLQDLISTTKGCYVGQEVMARLETYKRVQFVLQRFTLDEAYGALGRDIFDISGSKIGWTTSAVPFGESTSIGLALIKPHFAEKSYLALETGENSYFLSK